MWRKGTPFGGCKFEIELIKNSISSYISKGNLKKRCIEYIVVMRKKKILPFTTAWMTQEDIVLSEMQ